MKRLIAMPLAALALTGCDGGGLTEGRIEQKVLEPERTFVMVTPICTTTGGKNPITTCTPIPFVYHDDADYRLDLVVEHEHAKTSDHVGKDAHRGSVHVDPALFERAQVGQWFDGETVSDDHERRDKAITSKR